MYITFDAMRHGEKDGDALTERGFRQVAASAQKHFGEMMPTHVFSSGRIRANQCAEAAVEAIGLRELPIEIEPGFGYDWIEEDPGLPRFDFDSAERLLIGRHGDALTAHHWLRVWPPAWGIRGRFTATMLHWAYAIWREDTEKIDRHVLIATHSPVGILAAPDPSKACMMGFADIARYRVLVNDSGGATIISMQQLPCPSVD